MKKNLFAKLLCLLLVAAMAFSMVACTAKPVEPKPGEDEVTTPVEGNGEETTEREPVELIIYTHATYMQPGFEKTMEAVNAYLKEKLNTTVDFRIYPQADYKEAVTTIFQSGDEMDALLVGTTGVDFSMNVTKNAFIDISDYIDTYLPGTKAALPEAAWDAYSYQDGIYGICSIKDLSNQMGWWVNDDLVADYGDVAFPADTYYTYRDLVDYWYELRDARDAKYPELAEEPILHTNHVKGSIKWDFYDFFVGSYDSPLVITGLPGVKDYEGVKSGEEVTSYFYTKEFREYCHIMKQLRDDGMIPFDVQAKSIPSEQMVGGMVWGDLSTDGYFPFPTTMNYAKGALQLTAGMLAAGWAIPQQCTNVERTLEVLELMNTDQYLATMMHFGPEGIGWNDADGDGVLEFEGTENDPALEIGEKCWYQWYGFALGSMAASKAPAGYPADFADRIYEMNRNGISSGNLGFAFDASNVQNELAACSAVMTEYLSILDNGKPEDVDATVDEFVAKLDANGLPTILEECQAQLTAWRAANGK